MIVARSPGGLEACERAVAIGTFDGVHLGHRRVLRAALDSGLTPAAVTFDPHPRIALGNRVELLTTLERRLELLDEIGYDAVDLGPLSESWRTQPGTPAYGLMYAADENDWTAGARPADGVEVAQRAAKAQR